MLPSSNADTILVQIRKSRIFPSDADLSQKSSDSTSEPGDKVSASKDIFTYVVETDDDRGIKDYGRVKLSRVGSDDEKINKHAIKKRLDDMKAIGSKKDLAQHSSDLRHITFLDEKSKKNIEAPSLSLPEVRGNKRYYLNFDGKLSVRSVTPVEADKMNSEHRKIEIALSILDEVLSKIGVDSEEISVGRELKVIAPSISSIKFVAFPALRERLKGETREDPSLAARKSGEKIALKHKIEGISALAKELSLPIKVFKNRPFLDTKAKVEQVLMQSDIFGSATTLTPVGPTETKPLKSVSDHFGSSATMISHDEVPQINSPFEPRWCFGFNTDVQIVNLSTDKKSLILFANSQFPVLYDFHEDTMHFMQGHLNNISCLARNSTGTLLVSADSGSNSRIIIWNDHPCVVDVLEGVHPDGTILAGLSASGEYLVTVSPPPHPLVQFWIWREDKKTAAGDKYIVEPHGEVVELTMNPYCEEEFVLTSQFAVSFFSFKRNGATASERLHCEILHEIHSRLGSFTDTTYLPREAKALSSTSKGYVIVWEDKDKFHHTIHHVKHVRLHLEGITHIEVVDQVVALATVSGNIRFYDYSLKFLWASKEQLGTLVTLSFNLSGKSKEVVHQVCARASHSSSCAVTWRKEAEQLIDATLQNKHFHVRHFVISTKNGELAYFNSTKEIPQKILYPSSATYTALDVMPQSSYICAGTSEGQVILIDFCDCKIKVKKQLPLPGDDACTAVSFLRYSPSGLVLACAMYSGEIWLLDPLLLTPRYLPLTNCVDCITHLVFSSRSDYFAVSDTGMCVTVFFLSHPPVPVGQFKAHSRGIRDIMFVAFDDRLRLFSVGEDRNIVLFEVFNKSEGVSDKVLKFVNIHRAEQTAVPCCIVPYTLDEKYYLMVNTELTFLLVQHLESYAVTDEHESRFLESDFRRCTKGKMKFKLLEADTLRCCKTIQAPNLESSITFLECFTGNGQPYLLYGTDQEIGLHILPPDGNPYKSLAYRMSPTRIICCRIHSHGKYMFTISENCSVINVWKINTMAVDEFYTQGGVGLNPFLSLLEGGKGGWQEKDLREFFLFGQFIHQGERPSTVRTLSKSLRVCEMINIFQALGFFPTKYQIDNILYEVLGPDISRKHQADTKIKYEDFVKVYLNHRPCRELTETELRQAFLDFYEGAYFTDRDPSQRRLDVDPFFNTESLVEKLVTTGEDMTFQEMYTSLSTLMENKLEIRHEDFYSVPPMPFMPKEISFETFLTTLLGFKNYS